jgi:beta-glucosidase
MTDHTGAPAGLATGAGHAYPLSRRSLLRAAAVAASTPVLAACTTGTPAPTPSPSATAGPATPLGLTFPADFSWGAATSAYQIEGAVTADGRGPSIWDTFSHTAGKTRNGETGDVADDHYHLWQSDLDLMKSYGLHSYRFSIAWPRILPTGRGTPNQKGIDFYKRLVDGLHQRGITPMGTLFHWDLPQALQDQGGWENRDCAQWFADYATVVFNALGDAVPTWLTINEPKTIVNVGYRYGVHAPGKRDESAAQVACHHLLLAHGRAVQALRATGHKAAIGPALNLAPAYPAVTGDTSAAKQAVLADGFENRLFLDPILKGSYPADILAELGPDAPGVKAIKDGDLKIISSPVDILGVNYYNPVFVNGGGSYVTLKPTSEATWEQIYPQGMYDILTKLRTEYPPIPLSVTENGYARDDQPDAAGGVDDPERIAYVRDHLSAMHKAMLDGAKVVSYHVWSLLDNFEWAEGYGQRWGITYVDFATQKRTPKSSAKWYAASIARNGI